MLTICLSMCDNDGDEKSRIEKCLVCLHLIRSRIVLLSFIVWVDNIDAMFVTEMTKGVVRDFGLVNHTQINVIFCENCSGYCDLKSV